ncbi:hypothetical protein GQ457_15G021900 [Hibiscus cannabinus]
MQTRSCSYGKGTAIFLVKALWSQIIAVGSLSFTFVIRICAVVEIQTRLQIFLFSFQSKYFTYVPWMYLYMVLDLDCRKCYCLWERSSIVFKLVIMFLRGCYGWTVMAISHLVFPTSLLFHP